MGARSAGQGRRRKQARWRCLTIRCGGAPRAHRSGLALMPSRMRPDATVLTPETLQATGRAAGCRLRKRSEPRDGPRWVPSVASPVGRASEAAFPTRIRSGPATRPSPPSEATAAPRRSVSAGVSVRLRPGTASALCLHDSLERRESSWKPSSSSSCSFSCSGAGAITGTAGAGRKLADAIEKQRTRDSGRDRPRRGR